LTEGIFYPRRHEELEQLIDRLLQEAKEIEAPPSQPFGALIPHAAYDIVGPLIAAGMRPLHEKPTLRRLIIIAPVHRDHFTGCVVPGFRSFCSPLGEIEVDRESVEKLLAADLRGLRRDSVPFLEEHAVELPLPFLRRLSPRSPVLPILTGDNSAATERHLCALLEELLVGDPAEEYIVVSSNLTGFVDPARAPEHRDRFLELTEQGDARGIREALERKEISACGAAACAAVMRSTGLPCTTAAAPHREQPEKDGRAVYYGSLYFSPRQRDGRGT